MIDFHYRCYKCMNKLNKNVVNCPYCNSAVPSIENSKNCLKQGTVLSERYIIGSVISQNNESITYIALDQHLDMNVAIKELFPNTLLNRIESGQVCLKSNQDNLFENIKTKFINLFEALSKFRTMPNILKVFSVFSENNTVYTIQELPNGITLRKYLSNYYGELRWEDCSNMFLELIKSIQHLHNSNIIHGGLSPETILVENNTFKIIDFSTQYLRLSNENGLPNEIYDGYASPEQYGDQNFLGTYSDVYGIAAVMYKSLTGTMPISSNTRAENDNLIPPDILNSDVPKNVSLAIMAALKLSPKLRTQTMEDFYAEIITPPRLSQKTTKIENIKKPDDFEHSSDIEPKQEMNTHRIILLTMLISTGVAMLSLAIIIFILFG